MAEKTYLVRLKDPPLSIPMLASSIEIQGDHIALLDSEGKLTALLLREAVESWSEVPQPVAARL
jgi:hypothetical protein